MVVAFGITPDDDADPGGWLSERVLRPAAENPERTQALFVQRLPWIVFALVPVLGTEVVSDLTSFAILTVLFLALRRVYRESPLRTMGKQAALMLVHLLVITLGLSLLLIITGLSI